MMNKISSSSRSFGDVLWLFSLDFRLILGDILISIWESMYGTAQIFAEARLQHVQGIAYGFIEVWHRTATATTFKTLGVDIWGQQLWQHLVVKNWYRETTPPWNPWCSEKVVGLIFRQHLKLDIEPSKAFCLEIMCYDSCVELVWLLQVFRRIETF